MTTVSLVVAQASNGTIGQHGKVPWNIPADLRHFKSVTMGKPCIMGRKTWESLPKKPLPGRTNIVLTRDGNFRGDGAVAVHSLEDAFARAEAEGADEIVVIGGADVYRAALPRADCIYLTEVHAGFEGDVSMPVFNALEWKEVAREDHAASETGGLAFSFVTFERRFTSRVEK
jgi:dihydrofolate reductase